MPRSASLANQYWKQISRWWWVAAAVVVSGVLLAAWIWVRPNLSSRLENDLLIDILPLGVLLTLVVGITLGWVNTKSAHRETLRQIDLQSKLRRRLIGANNWDEFVTILFEFLDSHVPLNGLSLYIYDPATNKNELKAKQFLNEGEEPHWLGLELALNNQPVGQLKVQIATRELFLPDHFGFLKGILPEVSLTADRTRLLLSNPESSTAIEQTENTEIVRYLHDTLGDNLAFLRMKLEHLVEETEYEGSNKWTSELQRIRDIADQAYVQVRGILDELSLGISPDFGASLQECITLIESRARFKVEYQTEGKPGKLAGSVQRQILYIVREVLRNVEKHTRAQQVTLRLIWSDTGLTLETTNDGQGFDVVKDLKVDGHHGLKIVQEIVNELNGHLEVTSLEEKGTQVTIRIPY